MSRKNWTASAYAQERFGGGDRFARDDGLTRWRATARSPRTRQKKTAARM